MPGLVAGILLSIALGTARGDTTRVLELRLPPAPDASLAPAERLDGWLASARVGVSDVETLAELVRLGGIDGVALWIASEQAGSELLGDEPQLETPDQFAARGGEQSPIFLLIRALEQELAGRSVELALGRASPSDSPDRVHRRILWPDRAPPTRVHRPGLRTLLWFDVAFAASQLQAAGPHTSVEADAVLALPPERRLAQLSLDVAAFAAAELWDGRRLESYESRALRLLWRAHPQWSTGLPDDPAARDSGALALLEQSDLISGVATHLGGAEPHRIVPAANTWLGTRPSRSSVEVWRRPPAALDLLEWTLRDSLRGLRLPEVALRDDAATPPPGVLPAPERRALRRFFLAREAAALRLREHLLEGRPEDRLEALRQLDLAEAAAAEIEAAHRPAIDTEHDRAEAWADLVPLRVLRQEWQLLELRGRQQVAIGTTDTFVIDDGRFGDWPARMRTLLGGDRIDLSGFLSGGAEGRWVLEAVLPSAEARNARLVLAADAHFDVELNGGTLVSDYDARDAGRGPLRLNLPLAAARNVLRVTVHCSEPIDAVLAELLPLARPFEGHHLGPAQAREVFEPVRTLEHPLAIGGQVLVIPDRPRSTDAVAGSVEFSLDPNRLRRVDVWVHGLAPEGRGGELLLEVDDGQVQPLALPPGGGWSWVRSPAPVSLEPGVRMLRLRFRERGVMVDGLSILESGTAFPEAPRGDGGLHESAWRYDPLGQGQRVDLGGVRSGDGPRVFTPSKTQGYRVFVWMKGDRPLRRSEQCEIELSTSGHTWRFSLPSGTPVEEWVALGRLNFQADDPVLLRARGEGRPTFLCFVP